MGEGIADLQQDYLYFHDLNLFSSDFFFFTQQ